MQYIAPVADGMRGNQPVAVTHIQRYKPVVYREGKGVRAYFRGRSREGC